MQQPLEGIYGVGVTSDLDGGRRQITSAFIICFICYICVIRIKMSGRCNYSRSIKHTRPAYIPTDYLLRRL